MFVVVVAAGVVVVVFVFDRMMVHEAPRLHGKGMLLETVNAGSNAGVGIS